MKKTNLNKFIKGWFIGNFEPTLLKTKKFEVGIKRYKKGQKDEFHYHKKALEISVVVDGEFLVNKKVFKKDDIFIFNPYEKSNFSCLKDGIIAVVKTPSVKNDKFIINS